MLFILMISNVFYIKVIRNESVLERVKKMSSERKVVEKSKKLINSFKYAIQGILSSFKTERNMKIHIFIMILVIIAGFILKINKYEWIACILCFAVVISGELFNTAIETVVDMVMPYKNDKAKIAKDIAAGAVLTLAIGAAAIGAIIYVPKIF